MSDDQNDSVRAKLLNRAHAVLSALQALDSAMAEHNEDQVGEDLARPLVAIRSRLEGTADFMAERLPPVERTPETVLRAMLRAYERAALEAEVTYMRTCPDAEAASGAQLRAERLAFWCERLRREVASVIAWGETPHLLSEIAADYEARLRGDRPLDAPPLENHQP